MEEVELPIKEERPVSWLKFEERLLRERNKRKDQPLSTTRGDLENWAKECGVPDPLLAITFFHDTGVIIDQGEYSAEPAHCTIVGVCKYYKMHIFVNDVLIIILTMF